MLDITINVSVEEFVLLLKFVSVFFASFSAFTGFVLFLVKKKRLKMELEDVEENINDYEFDEIFENGGI